MAVNLKQRKFNLKAGVGEVIAVDSEIKGIITQISIRAGGVSYQVEWFHNGAAQTNWFEDYRVELA